MQTTRQSILAANQYGINEYRRDDISYVSWHTPALRVAYDLGIQGVDLSTQPDVSGWRRGNLPESGISTNHATGDSERGLSLMAIGDDKAHWSEMFSGDRNRVDVTGLLLPYTGTDDEPLVLAYGLDNWDN